MERDAELIEDFLSGSEEAFNRLVLRHQKMVFNIAYRYLGNYDDASEVAQDAFVKVYKSLGKFRGESKFSTWLCSIVLNLSRNRCRKMKGKKFYSLDEPIDTGEGEVRLQIADNSEGPDEALEKKEMRSRIHACLNRLSPEYREALVLRDIRGMDYNHISHVLNCAEGTVKSRLYRGRMELRKMLERMTV